MRRYPPSSLKVEICPPMAFERFCPLLGGFHQGNTPTAINQPPKRSLDTADRSDAAVVIRADALRPPLRRRRHLRHARTHLACAGQRAAQLLVPLMLRGGHKYRTSSADVLARLSPRQCPQAASLLLAVRAGRAGTAGKAANALRVLTASRCARGPIAAMPWPSLLLAGSGKRPWAVRCSEARRTARGSLAADRAHRCSQPVRGALRLPPRAPMRHSAQKVRRRFATRGAVGRWHF